MSNASASLYAKYAKRWDLLAFILVLFGPALVVVAVAAARHRADDLQRALIRDANALLAAPKPRPSHAERPVPGTFGDMLAPHLAALASAEQRLPAIASQVRPIIEGKRPTQDVPAYVAAELEGLRPLVNQVLRASHAELAGPPEALSAVHAWDGKQSWKEFVLTAKLASIVVWKLVEDERADDAVAICVDGLGFGRDIGIGTGVIGRVVGAKIQDDLSWACAAALDDASCRTKRRAISQLISIQRTVPSFSTSVHEDFVALELGFLGSTLDGWVLDALAEPARQAVRNGDAQVKASLFTRLVTRDAWADFAEGYRELGHAMRLPENEREAVVRRVGVRLGQKLNPYALIAVPNFSRQADAHRASQSFVTALAVGAGADVWRCEHGEWPSALQDALPELQGLAGAGELSSAPTIDPDGTRLVVRVTFRGKADDGTPVPATREFRFRPDARQ